MHRLPTRLIPCFIYILASGFEGRVILTSTADSFRQRKERTELLEL
jgi:hypothetical protein